MSRHMARTACAAQMMRGAISKFFPAANHEMTKAAACMFTTTQDSHFIVDLHPKYKQVQHRFDARR